jgi:hypothetical protein
VRQPACGDQLIETPIGSLTMRVGQRARGVWGLALQHGSPGQSITSRFSAGVLGGSLQCPDLRPQDVARVVPSLPYDPVGGPLSPVAFSAALVPSGVL